MSDIGQRIVPTAIRKTLDIACAPDRAFRIFAHRMGDWWDKSHSIAKGKVQTGIIVEPKVGGRWYETASDGSEEDWGRVIAYDPPRHLQLNWQLNREFTYDPDLETIVDIRFEGVEGGTRVHFEHRQLERLGEGIAPLLAEMDGGWGMLLDRFKDAVERG